MSWCDCIAQGGILDSCVTIQPLGQCGAVKRTNLWAGKEPDVAILVSEQRSEKAFLCYEGFREQVLLRVLGHYGGDLLT
jgi:hypothetical protein